MKILPLYRYRREDGGITDTPIKPEGVEYTERVRLVAEEGTRITKDGSKFYTTLDVDSAEGFYLVPYTEGENEISNLE